MRIPRSWLTARSLAALAAALLVSAMLGSPAGADTTSELAAAKKKLDALIPRIAAAQGVLDALQAQANIIAGQVDAVQSRIAGVEADIAQTQADISNAGKQILATQAQLDERVRLAYEDGPSYSLELLLGSASYADLSDGLAIVNAAANSDHQLILQIQALQAELGNRRQDLLTLQTGLRSQQADLASKERALQSKLAAAGQVVDQLDRDKADAAALVKKLKAQRAAELAAAEAAASHGGPAIKGVFFVCPVDQPHAYSDDFGAPRYAGGYHPHAGNDIFAPLGTPIRATFNGTATNASNPYGGLAVEVTGSLGYTYNAHLSAFSNLGAVSTGEIIGYVGNSGDAAGGPTHDHFEWHPNVIPSPLWVSPYGYSLIGTAIDPYPYLNSVC